MKIFLRVRADEIQDGLCEWSRRLLVADAQEMTDSSRAALELEILQVAHMMWSVAAVARHAQSAVYA
jgi:hypothetical protein